MREQQQHLFLAHCLLAHYGLPFSGICLPVCRYRKEELQKYFGIKKRFCFEKDFQEKLNDQFDFTLYYYSNRVEFYLYRCNADTFRVYRDEHCTFLYSETRGEECQAEFEEDPREMLRKRFRHFYFVTSLSSDILLIMVSKKGVQHYILRCEWLPWRQNNQEVVEK